MTDILYPQCEICGDSKHPTGLSGFGSDICEDCLKPETIDDLLKPDWESFGRCLLDEAMATIRWNRAKQKTSCNPRMPLSTAVKIIKSARNHGIPVEE